MGLNPSIPLAVNPPQPVQGPLDEYAKLMQIRGLVLGQQLGAADLQEKTQQNQRTYLELQGQRQVVSAEHDPEWDASDPDKTLRILRKYSVPIQNQQNVIKGITEIQTVADTYRRPMSLDEAEDFLQSANNDLHSYYAKNKVGQQVAAKDPETGHVVAEADALRKELYDTLDNLTGPGAADLKQRYGALSNVEGELLRRKNVAARQQPQSLAEQLSMARAAGKIAVGVMRASPASLLEGTESLAAAKWLKERNTTDSIIGRAFEKVGDTGGRRTTPFAPGAGAVGALAAGKGAQDNSQTLADLLGQ